MNSKLKNNSNNFKYNSYIVLFLATISIYFTFCNSNNKQQKDWNKIDKVLIEVNQDLVITDQQLIEEYIKKNNLQMTKTPTGLWYIFLKTGKSKKPQIGNVVTIAYKVDLLNGTHCYSSDSLGLKTIKLGFQDIETGLTEGLQLMPEGSQAMFIMPPHLAHGLVGDDNKIPPRSTIIYYVELINIK